MQRRQDQVYNSSEDNSSLFSAIGNQKRFSSRLLNPVFIETLCILKYFYLIETIYYCLGDG